MKYSQVAVVTVSVGLSPPWLLASWQVNTPQKQSRAQTSQQAGGERVSAEQGTTSVDTPYFLDPSQSHWPILMSPIFLLFFCSTPVCVDLPCSVGCSCQFPVGFLWENCFTCRYNFWCICKGIWATYPLTLPSWLLPPRLFSSSAHFNASYQYILELNNNVYFRPLKMTK